MARRRHVRRAGAVGAALVAAGSALVTASATAAPLGAAPPPVSWTSRTAAPPADPTVSAELFRQVAVLPDGEALAVGAVQSPFAGSASWAPLVERLDGAGWTRVAVPAFAPGPPDQQFAGVTALAADDVWVVGQGTPVVAPSQRAPWVVHFDGAAWRTVAVPGVDRTVDTAMTAVAARAPGDVWAVGYVGSAGAVWHWDGAAWSGGAVRTVGCRVASPVHLTAVTVTPDGVVTGGDCVSSTGVATAVVARPDRPGVLRVVARVTSTSGIADLVTAADGTVWGTGTQVTAGRTRPFLVSGTGADWKVRYRPVPADGRGEQASGLALTAAGVTVVGEVDGRSARAPFAATWSGTRWLPAAVTAPGGSGGWLTAVDGGPAGPVVAVGQYPAGRPALLPFSASPPPTP